MKTVLKAAEDVLNKLGFRYKREADDSVLLTHFAGKNVNFTMVLQADEERRRLLVLSFSPINAPSSRRQEVLELVARLNWKSAIGSLDLSDDGEVRFRTSIMFGEAEAEEELVKHLVLANLVNFDFNFQAIADVVFGNMKAKDAIAHLEPETFFADEGQPRSSRGVSFGGRLGKLMEGRN